MNKKGISPLIGTVLLVAIVIAMVLLVMPWIQKTIVSQQEKTTESAKQLDCITDLDLMLTSDAAGVVSLDNRGSVGIKQVVYRVYDSTGAVTSPTKLGDGSAVVVAAYSVVPATGVTCPVGGRVEAIATLESGVVCSDTPAELTC